MTVLQLLQVKGDRLNDSINRLAKVGQTPNGHICRLAFSPEDLQARNLVRRWMEEAGMTVQTDAAGNLIATYPGKVEGAPALATGSHIDTVPSGGPYDGVLGVLAGIEVVRVLRENQIQLNHPLQVIVFSDEESTMIGSRTLAGNLNRAEAASVKDLLAAAGGDWDELESAQRSRSDIAAFVELHVEQGSVLEFAQKEVGIVQGVVGMNRYAITITGQANHAGTTPMTTRQDALIAAARIVLTVQEMALKLPSQPVATVGMLNVAPNAANIVPGHVDLTVDMRDLSQEVLDQMTLHLTQALGAIATETQTQIDLVPILRVAPSPAAASIQEAIARSCCELGLSYRYMPSRAGHDAMEVGRFTDMGMIFVPSQDGVSHSGEEYTSPEQCTQGANVLLQTLLALDAKYPC